MAFFNISLNFNNFCNCSLNNMFMPFSNFSFFNFNMPIFNFPTFNMGNFMPYQSFQSLNSFQQPISNYQNTDFLSPSSFSASNFNYSGNLWNQAGFNTMPSFNFDSFSPSNARINTDKNSNKKATSLQLKLVSKAKSYIGKVNSDAEGNRLFSPNGTSQAWCADFVTYNTKATFGNKLPQSFGSSSVSGLRSWAESNDCYLKVPSSGKAEYISKNIKPGDIMIEKSGGKSHTGIVTKVNSDGSFETVEGNCSNKVKTMKYSANSSTLSGFISLAKYV